MLKVAVRFLFLLGLSIGSIGRANTYEQDLFSRIGSATAQPVGLEILMDQEVLGSPTILNRDMKFYFADENPALQDLIDTSILRIFSTLTGKQLCRGTGDRAPDLLNQLGVSPAVAVKLSEICTDVAHTEGRARVTRFTPKKYAFVTHLPARAPFYSWTTMMTNTTYLFIEPTITQEDFIARLTHELTVGMDAKLLVSPKNLAALTETFHFKVEKGLLNSGLEKEINLRIPAVTLLPVMNFSFVTLRAMLVELDVVRQLFDEAGVRRLNNPQIFSLLAAQKYEKAFALMATALIPLQDFLMPPEYDFVPRRDRHLAAAPLYINEDQLKMWTDIILKSDLTFVHDSGRKFTLFEWLMLPAVGPQSLMFNRGPRPNMGGGW